ncbi:MAG: CDP-glycerol glycerophosphotransferase family protein [Bacteroidales bacterium]|jgi:CDP-ribitol ribitolphosphotransferase|nr:CDP-glycerol glycerophosphotransferase family protein [Bacteroidales bacterium]
MRTSLFCKNPYAFGILKPINDELLAKNHRVIWYVPEDILEKFPYKNECNYTSNIQEISDFKNDIIIAPGNEVPPNLRGFKVQIFHGLAGEKKGHFRIRKYFDLYLTQGPYFTSRFKNLAKKFKDFDVFETGWPKLDLLFQNKEVYFNEKQILLKEHNAKRIVLYAPTFSPSLTSSFAIKDEIFNLANSDTLLLIKFHDLMNKKVISDYETICAKTPNAKIISDNDIIKYLILSDIMISDTSSVIYEFLLLDKPVITFKSNSENIKWKDISDPKELMSTFKEVIDFDKNKNDRKWIIDNYHPYTDGLSSKRIVETLEEYIQNKTIPEKRKLPWGRKRKMIKMFGKIN